jgi:hypothetical protein
MSDELNTVKSTVLIDGKETEISTLPQQSIVALLQRGINHVLSNEVASKVSTAKKKMKEDGVTPEYDEAALEKLEEETFAEKVKAILEGTLGTRGPGVARMSPLEKEMRNVAWLVIQNSPGVQSGKVKLPTGKGSGEAKAAMIDSVLAKHGEKIRAKAEANLAANAELGDILS